MNCVKMCHQSSWLLYDNCVGWSDVGLRIPEHSGLASGVRCDDSVSALGSRRSLADTSVTSTADLSVFSSGRSHAPDNSLDTHSNVSDDGTGSDGWDFLCRCRLSSLLWNITERKVEGRRGRVRPKLIT